MNEAFARHLQYLIAIVGACLLGVAAFNVIADPFGSFHLVFPSRIAPYAGGLETRMAKSEMIERADWDTLLLGTSRTQMALDPAHPALSGHHVYNAGLYGADFTTLDTAARLAVRRGRLKHLILCVDMYSFDADWDPVPETNQSLLNPDLNRIDYRLSTLLSSNALYYSTSTISNLHSHIVGRDYPLGFLRSDQKRHTRSEWILGGYFNLTLPPAAEESADWCVSPEKLRALTDLLADLSRAGVKVDVVQLPMHGICLERYFALNRWGVFQRWVASIVRVTDEHNQRFPMQTVRFWDFAGYYPYTTDLGFELSPWFYDPFHLRSALGNLVLDRILEYPSPVGQSVANFGLVVTSQNLRSHLDQLERDHQRFYDSHPEVRAIRKAICDDRARRPVQ